MKALSSSLQKMMTSYLIKKRTSKLVFHDKATNLFHLVRLGLCTLGLQVDDVRHAFTSEDMMIASNPFLKAEPRQQLPERVAWPCQYRDDTPLRQAPHPVRG